MRGNPCPQSQPPMCVDLVEIHETYSCVNGFKKCAAKNIFTPLDP